jgi:very-short-patch-repair endonuclease
MGTSRVNQEARRRAHELRQAETPIERRLWKALRDLKAREFHFRRQAPIGPYVVDFACLSARFIVEADGITHESPDVAAHDARRDAFLSREGFRVLRVPNGEVVRNLDGVMETVMREPGVDVS